ncbi:MAG: M24 family metallopeptidase C-terminal domain-containing protein, partial [Lachnospiraceae bacterium]|nr:M24 family metallopeptidase C-terminal domain-containing protein [Lachnospiraceae bacterium]
GKFGIRTENMVVCVKDKETVYGKFLKLENLTMVPMDIDAMDFSMLTAEDKARLNAYHKEVYEKISPYMDEEELVWLKEATREI